MVVEKKGHEGLALVDSGKHLNHLANHGLHLGTTNSLYG